MIVVRGIDAPCFDPAPFTGELHRHHPRSSPVNFTGIPRILVPVNNSCIT